LVVPPDDVDAATEQIHDARAGVAYEVRAADDALPSAPDSGITVVLDDADALGALDLWAIALAHREQPHADRRSTAWVELLEDGPARRCGVIAGLPPGERPEPFDPRYESAFFRWEDYAYRIMLQGGQVTTRKLASRLASLGSLPTTTADRARFEQKWNIQWRSGWAPRQS
jgi:hypothetical protein